jgi:hypothetical protein
MPVLSPQPASPAPSAGRISHAWTGWTGLCGLAVLFAALRWNNIAAPLIRDEGEYAYAAHLLSLGLPPYENAFIQKPPMVVYSYWLANFLWSGCFWSARLLAALFVAGATLLLGWIARREFGRGLALPAIWLMTPMVFLPAMEQFTANTEMFLLLPLLGVLALYCQARQDGHGAGYWLAAGLLAVTTLLYKYTALPVLAYLFAVWLVELWRTTGSFKRCAQALAALLLGGLLAAGLELGWLLKHDGGAALWDCTVTFNRHYLASDNFSWSSFLQLFNSFLGAWWGLFLLAAAAWLKPSWRLAFWSGALLCAGVATGASRYGHYYVLLMPFWALLAAVGVQTIAEVLARALAGRSTFRLPQIKTSLTALAVMLVLLPDAPLLTLPPATFAAAKFARRSVFLESEVVGRRVAKLSSPDDRVWVAASEPQILCYAHRLSATRFITVYALVIPSPEREHYQDLAIQEVQAARPKLLVWARSWLQEEPQPSKYLRFLNATMARDYERVGGYVLAGTNSAWMEPLPDDDAPAASIVLYRLKAASH